MPLIGFAISANAVANAIKRPAYPSACVEPPMQRDNILLDGLGCYLIGLVYTARLDRLWDSFAIPVHPITGVTQICSLGARKAQQLMSTRNCDNQKRTF